MTQILLSMLTSLWPAQVDAADPVSVVPATQPDQATLQAIEDSFNVGQASGATGGAGLSPWSWLDRVTDLPLLQSLLGLGALIAVALVVHFIVRGVMVYVVKRIFKRTKLWWDDVLLEQKVFHRIELLLPVILIERGVQFVPHLSDEFRLFVTRICLASVVLLVVVSLGAFLTAVNVIYSRYPIARGRPIKGYLQVVKLLAYIAAGIMMITALFGLQPWWFLSGVGAMMAVILLVFRDTLLSLVAGIQLVNNDLVRVGDWIEMPQFNADGDVVDISLNVVKVNNWDKTTTMIPTHKFLEHSFKNWRSMSESGGRRIKRSIFVDISTIRFLTQDEVARFSRFKLLSQYIQDKSNEISAYNQAHCPADAADVIANARHLTNVGTLRAYVVSYLRSHPMIHQEMTFLVRQLAPTAQGLPLEIYVFTNDTRWGVYENIQADIFDHILAITPEFGLRVYQEPSGTDMRAIGQSGGQPTQAITPQSLKPLGFQLPKP